MPMPHRLRKHADYQHAYARSRRQTTRQMAYFLAPRPPERRSSTPGPRIGLTVPKALGKAHDRNRIKRRLRAAIAANLALLTGPIDVILHPRRSALTMEFALLTREVAGIFRAAQSYAERARRAHTDAIPEEVPRTTTAEMMQSPSEPGSSLPDRARLDSRDALTGAARQKRVSPPASLRSAATEPQ